VFHTRAYAFARAFGDLKDRASGKAPYVGLEPAVLMHSICGVCKEPLVQLLYSKEGGLRRYLLCVVCETGHLFDTEIVFIPKVA